MIRCTTIMVLGLLQNRLVFAYIGADLGLYLLVKIARGDFFYWVPFGAIAEIFTSIIARVVVKVIVDFTSIMQFRHPYELGGAYWIFSFVLTMGSLPIAIKIHENQSEGDSRGESKGIEFARMVVKLLIPITASFFVVFFLNIDRAYWNTFLR